MWPCIAIDFFIIKPTRCISFPNLFRHETLHVSGSSSAHHQEFIHCTLGTGICRTGFKTAFEQDQDGTAGLKTAFEQDQDGTTWNSTCFGQFLCPSWGFYSLYTRHWYMSGWNCSSILVLLESCLQTCMTYTSAECTGNKHLMMGIGTSRNT